MTKVTQDTPGLVEATLKKPHRHNGKECAVGEKIELTKAQAERLTRRKVI